MQTDEWCKRIQACICAKGRYCEHLGLMQMFVYICAVRKNQVISSKRLVCLAGKTCIFTVCSRRSDGSVQNKFGLRPDIWCDLEDHIEFWTDLEDKTERLSSLEKFTQISLKQEFGLRTKSDLFYQVAQCSMHNVNSSLLLQ